MTTLDFTASAIINQFQEDSLKQLLQYLNSHSPFYREHFRKHAIAISSIKTIKDLVAIPVVNKDDLQQWNMDFLCVAKNSIVEYCTTSGTMGLPVTIALTEKDLQRLAENELDSFKCAGMSGDDIVLLMLSLDRLFMAGIAYYLGARELGAGIIRGGPGNFAMQLDLINQLQPTVLVAVPSFIVGLATYALEKTIDLNTTSVKKIICIGENIRTENLALNALGLRIRDSWNVELFSTYASTEQQTAFTECIHGKGGHHHPKLLIFEILDDHGNQLPPGAYGELVITTLGVEGMPLLRYNTGDICAYFNEPCACGRNTSRISPVAGRKQQMIKYRGTTLFPQAIFNVLNALPAVKDYVIKLTRNDINQDELNISISLNNNTMPENSGIKQALQSALRVVPEINFVSLSEIQAMQQSDVKRKISKFIDLR